jgi:WD40 repeat protein
VEFSTDGKLVSATLIEWKDLAESHESSGWRHPGMILKCWDVESGTEITKPDSFSACNPLDELLENAPRRSMAFGPHGRGIRRGIDGWAYAPLVGKFVWPVYSTNGVDIWVWDASTDVSRRLIRGSGTYDNGFKVSADGRQLAVSRYRETIRLWPPLNDVLLRSGIDLSFAARETCVFDAQDGSEIASLPESRRHVFSPDGNACAMDLPDGNVAIYDTPFRKPYGQRVAIGFVVGVVVFLFLNLIQSSAYRTARATAGAIWRKSLQWCFRAGKLAR